MIIEHDRQVSVPQENRIIGEPVLENSTVYFNGKGNILYAENGIRLVNSRVTFGGDSAVVYLSASGRPYRLEMDVYRECTVYFGKESYFSDLLHVIASERKNVLIGNDGLFSFGIWIRTADPHLIINGKTGERVNLSKSVWIGDHVWLGQNAIILKGTSIGSGSILSAGAVAAGKTIGSNSIYAGNPARLIKNDIYWLGDCVHNYTKEQTNDSLKHSCENFIYRNSGSADRSQIDAGLTEAPNAAAKLEILRALVTDNTDRDRFYIPPEQKSSRWRILLGN